MPSPISGWSTWYAESDHSGVAESRTERWTPRTVTTDERGEYALHGLPVGKMSLRVHAPELPIWKDTIEIRSGETARADVALAEGATVEGVVRDVEGEPFAGAILRAFDEPLDHGFLQFGQFDYEDTFGYPAAVADAEGHYVLTAIPAGDVYLFASPPRAPRGIRRRSQMWAEEVLRAEPGARLFWSPLLSEGRVIEGAVTYRDGHPMPRVFVSARNDATGQAQSITTDEEGRFRFLNMNDAAHVLGV